MLGGSEVKNIRPAFTQINEQNLHPELQESYLKALQFTERYIETNKVKTILPFHTTFIRPRIVERRNNRDVLMHPALFTTSLHTLILNGIIYAPELQLQLQGCLIPVSATLRILDVNLITPTLQGYKLVRRLGDMVALRVLRFRFNESVPFSWIEFESFSWFDEGEDETLPSLPHLQELAVEAPPAIVSAFLSIVGPHLRFLDITGAPFDTNTSISLLMGQIGNNLAWSRTVTHFNYSLSEEFVPRNNVRNLISGRGITDEQLFIHERLLEPISQLESLTNLSLCFEIPPMITNGFIDLLASKCRGLRVLVIGGKQPMRHPTQVTISGVCQTLGCLTKLEALSLSIDWEDDTGILPIPSIKHLAIDESLSPEDTQRLAGAMKIVLPGLRAVYKSIFESERATQWAEALSILNRLPRPGEESNYLEHPIMMRVIDVLNPFGMSVARTNDIRFFLTAIKNATGFEEEVDDYYLPWDDSDML